MTAAQRPALPRMTVVLLGAAGAVVAAGGLQAVAGLVGPVFVALVLVLAIAPLQRALQRRLPTWLALALTLLCVYGVLLVLAVALAVSAAQLTTLLIHYGPRFRSLIEQVGDRLTHLGVTHAQIASVAGQFNLSRLTGIAGSVLNGAGGAVSALVLMLTVLFFLVLDAAGFPQLLKSAAPARPHLFGALGGFAGKTRRWLLATAGFGALTGVLDALVLLPAGVPLPWLWALFAFFANFIPNFGFVVALVPPALLALLTGGPGQALWVVVAFCVLNTLVGTFLAPRVVGHTVGLSATLTFLAVLLWGFVLGPLGALLAVPLSLLAKALLVDADPTLRWLDPLLSGTPQSKDQSEDRSEDQAS